MRARNIKPGFFENEDLHEISICARLVFIGMWCIADREGRLEDRPKKIKLQLIPYDNEDIDQCLHQLTERDFITRYVVDGKRYIQVNNFSKHQKPHPNETRSAIPPPSAAKFNIAQALVDEVITEDDAGMTIDDARAILNTMVHHGKPLVHHSEPLVTNGSLCSADCLNDDSLNDKEKHLPSSAAKNSTGETKQKAFSSPTATDGRFASPRKGKKATTEEWVNALGNGLRSWFEQEWWPVQLRKVGKKECAQAIHLLNPDADLRHQILSAYIRQRDSTFSRREVDKVPHPATWINGCRWEDDLSCADPYGIED